MNYSYSILQLYNMAQCGMYCWVQYLMRLLDKGTINYELSIIC